MYTILDLILVLLSLICNESVIRSSRWVDLIMMNSFLGSFIIMFFVRSRKSKFEPEMEQEKDAFYVVRKGDIIGVYRSLNDCQAQVGSSVKCLIEFTVRDDCLETWNVGC